MDDKLFRAVKDLLSLYNDMGFYLGGNYDEVLENLQKDPIDTIKSLNSERFFIDTNTLIDGIWSSNAETAASCENYTIQDIRKNAADLKEDILNALAAINEIVDVSLTIEYINNVFTDTLNCQAYSKCIGMSYWMLLYKADKEMDFSVNSNGSYTIGSVKSYLYLADIPDITTFIGYPYCLYEFHAELNPRKYSHTSINVAMFQDKFVVYANAEGYTNNCRDESKDKCIAKPFEFSPINIEMPANKNAEIIANAIIDYLKENKSKIKQNIKNGHEQILE